jgi:putative heme-binding domain-containing protein
MKPNLPFRIPSLHAVLGFYLSLLAAFVWGDDPPIRPDNFARENLVAWCIVPFDGNERGPQARAQMLDDLGLQRVAYDWREQHVPEFEQEILAYQQHGIEYFAFWGVHEHAFALFEKHGLQPQIWQMVPEPSADTHQAKVQQAAEQLLPLVERTRQLGSKLGLYNHGGWSGEPENLIAVCEYLRKHHAAQHVGIVYNQHHAHDHIHDFGSVLQRLRPYLLCLNLNGMTVGGDQQGDKILPLGAGDADLELLAIVRDSGYNGAIGIIGHTQDDVALRLQDNLDGLDWLWRQLADPASGPRPRYRTWQAKQPPIESGSQSARQTVDRWVSRALESGDPHRGLMVFASATSACLACHAVGDQGGKIGPDLVKLIPQRTPQQIVESVLWPAQQIEPQYRVQQIVTSTGTVHRGYIVERDEHRIILLDPATNATAEIEIEAIEHEQPSGTLMPDNLLATMTDGQASDLFRFLFTLGGEDGIATEEMNAMLAHANVHLHGPATFDPPRKPLDPAAWPSWEEPVNRGRIYDFYAKQADHFRRLDQVPPLLAEFPGLDGGKTGHWGNQDEQTWSSNLWNEIKLGSVQCGIFRGGSVVVPRGVCVRLGDDAQQSACFNPDTLSIDAIWQNGFLKFSTVRHGFMDGALMDGDLLPLPATAERAAGQYLGFYRIGNRVVFAYRVGGQEIWDSPWVENGQFVRQIAPAGEHALYSQLHSAPAQWPQTFVTPIGHGDGSPYAIDTIGLPAKNPWNSSFFFGGHDIAPDGSVIVATMRGDVWRVSNVEYPSTQATWRRIAAGLNQPQGVVVDQDGIFVVGRDQITRLCDLNGDGETDFYECFSNQYETSAAGHDFICGLQRDAAGNFYLASGNQGLVRISPDGKHATVVATGFRNPDGLGVSPDGLLTVPCSEGEWTPASMVCALRSDHDDEHDEVPHFGYRGPRNDQPPALPLVYLPRGLDNSSGGQTTVTSDRWGPLTGQLIHFSFGTGAHFLLLRDQVEGQFQGAVVPLPGEFRSGAHRGRFSPTDGQLYVSGMQGWGSYTPDGGCLQRVRYQGTPVQLPIGLRAHQNGVALTFSQPLDPQVASQAKNHFAQCWNYRYSSAYGSAEFSTKHFGVRGHDVLTIAAAHIGSDPRTLFLEIPEIQPVNQLHLRIQVADTEFRELFATVHKLAEPFADFDGYRPTDKQIARHPILDDLAMVTQSIPNPFRSAREGARKITIKTGNNLTFQTTELHARAGESLGLTLINPDVVPHNWALVKPGMLEQVGRLANQLIGDPAAAIRHYIPASEDVLAYTDVVMPNEKMTIYFAAPEPPGRYPFLCTFPGHWSVMNGVLIVE